MKAKSLSNTARPTILPESTLVMFTPGKSQKRTQGVVKLMPPVPAPDEKTIRQLNALACTPPFCTFRKARRHDTL